VSARFLARIHVDLADRDADGDSEPVGIAAKPIMHAAAVHDLAGGALVADEVVSGLADAFPSGMPPSSYV